MRHKTFGFSLANIIANMPYEVQAGLGQGTQLPKRCFLPKPEDNGSFVLPIRQSFIKNPRLMPGTRCMLTLLVGWAGKGRALETTRGSIAKHVGRSVRQVYRYLKDAAREGYLTYAYTKNRLGMITGLKIYLNFAVLKANTKNYKKIAKKPRNQDVTYQADTNENSISYSINEPAQSTGDDKLDAQLERLRLAMLQNPK